ncbi:MAG: hypothetical protein ABW137_02830 [Mycobacterium sp.]
MNIDREASARTPAWRDPFAIPFGAHRRVLLLRLRWHERAATRPLETPSVRSPRGIRRGRRRP